MGFVANIFKTFAILRGKTRTPFFPVGQSMAKGSPMGIVTGLDIINDPLAATLFKSLTNHPQCSLMYEQTFGGTAVALARIPKMSDATRTPRGI